MVTKEDMESRDFTDDRQKVSARVTYTDMNSRFQDYDLPDMLEEVLAAYCIEHGIQNRYQTVGDLCQLNEKTVRNMVSGATDANRPFLYKFTVGLKLDLDKANELFAKCGGELYEKNKADYVVMHALMDKDDIYDFLDEYEHYNCYPPLKRLRT